jgi:Sensors of blue-light using FAD
VADESVDTLQLIYASAATSPFTEQELGSLLVRARANNQRLGVSGLLVHHAGSFFQVLEGSPDAVQALYDRIALDKRHTRVLPLARGLVSQRAFGDWSMGFVTGAHPQLKALPGFNDFLRHGFELGEVVDGESRARKLAFAFRSGRYRQLVDGR